MNEQEIKFTERWNDYLEQYRESARRIEGEKIQVRVPHIFVAKRRTISWTGPISGFEEVKEKMEKHVPENLSSSSSVHGNDDRHSDFCKGTERR